MLTETRANIAPAKSNGFLVVHRVRSCIFVPLFCSRTRVIVGSACSARQLFEEKSLRPTPHIPRVTRRQLSIRQSQICSQRTRNFSHERSNSVPVRLNPPRLVQLRTLAKFRMVAARSRLPVPAARAHAHRDRHRRC
jgi:hypothetical protein